MVFQKQYVDHLEKDWRIVHAAVNEENGELILNISLARGVDCIIHDKINLKSDAKRLEEFEQAAGDYGEWEGLLDRRIGVIFDNRFKKRIVGYATSFFPLDSCWP